MTVPQPQFNERVWLAARLVYADSTVNPELGPIFDGLAPLLVSHTGRHCEPFSRAF